MSVLCDLSIASCIDDKDCLLDILDTEGRRHVSFDIGKGMVLCMDNQSNKVSCNVYSLVDYLYIAASTPWITKKNAFKWAL